MKLEQELQPIQRDVFIQDKSFGIGDMRVVLSILRDKLYSNPIKVLIQEVMTNARDANIENNTNEPIYVHLPSQEDPVFYVQDAGIGISPSRMYDVFIQYGKSTKRDCTKQSGGFGIGSKSPFAYTDSFTIETVTNEESVNVKRTYIAYLDETQVGKLMETSSDITTDPTGTKISVSVDPKDANEFERRYTDIVQYWKVKPKDNFQVSEAIQTTKFYEDENIIVSNLLYSYEENRVVVLVDEIPYPVKYNDFHTKLNTQSEKHLLLNNSHRVVIKCTNEEITVAASREQIELTQQNQLNINLKVDQSYPRLAQFVSNEVLSQKTYLDACKKYQQLPAFLTKLIPIGYITYEDKPLYNEFRIPNAYVTRYVKVNGKYERGENVNGISLAEMKSGIIIVNDTWYGDEKRRMETLLENENEPVFLVTPEMREEYDHEYKMYHSVISRFYTNWFLTHQWFWKEFNVRYASSIPKRKIVRAKTIRKPKGQTIDYVGYSFKSITGSFYQNSMPLEDIAKAKEIVYIDVKNKKPMLFGQEVSFENYQRITNFVYDHKRAPDGSQTVAIVALTEKERVELEDVKMTKIESYVMSAIADMILKDTDMFNCVSDHSEEYDDTFVGYYTTWMTDEVVNSIEDLEVREYVRRCRVNKKLRDKSNIWRKVMSIVNFPIEQHKYLETTKKALEKKFPLLFRIHFNNEFPMSDLNFYLNAINKGV